MAFLPPLAVFIIFNLALFFFHGSAKIVYEDGYTVTTVFDGNKHKISPHSLSPRPGFNDAVLLDRTNSMFYTLPLPLSEESIIKKFAGSGLAGFSDGDGSTAMFKEPESFAVDLKGNVYDADRRNLAVRKISKSGAIYFSLLSPLVFSIHPSHTLLCIPYFTHSRRFILDMVIVIKSLEIVVLKGKNELKLLVETGE